MVNFIVGFAKASLFSFILTLAACGASPGNDQNQSSIAGLQSSSVSLRSTANSSASSLSSGTSTPVSSSVKSSSISSSLSTSGVSTSSVTLSVSSSSSQASSSQVNGSSTSSSNKSSSSQSNSSQSSLSSSVASSASSSSRLSSSISSSNSSRSLSSSSSSSRSSSSSSASSFAMAVFPLSLSNNKKYLIDASGQPFLMTGDTAWSLPTQLSKDEALLYLNDRQQRGFNALLMEMMEHKFTSHSPHWRNAEGSVPFSNNNDFTTANAAFFAHVTWVIQQATDRGMLVLITPSYIGWGCGDEGWCAEMRANGTTKLFQYGQFLGATFRNFTNIVWVHSGDYVPPTVGNPSDMDLVLAIANGIKDTGNPAQFHTIHGDRIGNLGHSGSEISGFNALDIDTTYTGLGLETYKDSLDDWSRSQNIRPIIMFEALYEAEHQTPNKVLRAQIYQPLLSGSAGFLFGNGPIWYFGSPGDGNPGWQFWTGTTQVSWQDRLSSAGSTYSTRARQFFSSLPWHDLVPDVAHDVLIAGYFGVNPATSNAVLAHTPDQRVAVAYLTDTLTIKIDLNQFVGNLVATWVDPISGAMQPAADTSLPNIGTQDFTPPGNNSEGTTDWLLLLQVN